MTEARTIAKQSADFPNPTKDGRACELCGGRNFAMLHAWEAGNPWNPAAIPIAMWKCACGCTFLHPVPTSDQLSDQGDWWVLQKAHYVLRDRGVVVVVIPKLNGPTYRLHGAEWNDFRHGYHTFLFTAKTLSQLMREAGFHVRRWPRRNRIFDDILILWGQKVADHKS
jgi:hypothetical protein